MEMEINNFVIDTDFVDNVVDTRLLYEAMIYEHEFYKLLFDVISQEVHTKWDINNYLYHWVYSDNPNHYWRTTIPTPHINAIAKYINEAIAHLRVDNPNLIELLINRDNGCNIDIFKNFAVLSF